MGFQAAQPALVETLAGQQQVHAQRAAEAADRHEQLGEVGMLAQQLGELVDDDEQGGQRRKRRTVRAGTIVVGDVRESTRRPQHFLATVHLSGERVAHPADEVCLLREVGDDCGDMPDPMHPEKGCATLEVDEREVQRLGWVGRGHSEHQCAEELRLSRTGRADAQPVWAHAVLRGLVDVEVHRRSVLGDADGNRLDAPAASRRPLPLGVDAMGIVDAHQIQPASGGIGVGRTVGCHGGAVTRQASRAHDRLTPRQRIGTREVVDMQAQPVRVASQRGTDRDDGDLAVEPCVVVSRWRAAVDNHH